MTALVLLTLVGSTSLPVVGAPLEDTSTVHLGIALRVGAQAELDQLLLDLQNPESPNYHHWLTPQEYGDLFGLSPERYARILGWLTGHGFEVTPYPNRLFVEALGNTAKVRQLLGIQLRWSKGPGGRGRLFHGFRETPTLPSDFADDVLYISGLDTRLRHRRRLDVSGQSAPVLGAADFRNLYDVTSLSAASGLTTAVLGTQEGTQASQNSNPGAPFIAPSATAINAYFTTIANATATYNPIVMTNTQNDFDVQGSNQEYQLDVEMQSVGAANAKDIDLVLAPSSEVFVTGVQYIVNTLQQQTPITVVSTSLGYCEDEVGEVFFGASTTSTTPGTEALAMQTSIQQGLAEGQTWFAAAGDNGAEDCEGDTGVVGFNGGSATVDFPADLPEVVGLGGTMFSGAGSWDGSGNLTGGYSANPETTCNEGSNGVAGGGGQSMFFTKPSYQTGVGPEASDGQRDVPDISLEAASGTPGVAVYDCGSGQDQSCQGETTGTGNIDVFGGTSVASPLAAGFFALIAGTKGCSLGDIHAELYTLGKAGSSGFHDITTGNNSYAGITGFTAGPGYDLATGWGSLDVAQLAAAWPSCSVSTTGGSSSGGGSTTTTVGSSTSGSSSGGASSSSSSTSPASSSTSGGVTTTSSSSSTTNTSGGTQSSTTTANNGSTGSTSGTGGSAGTTSEAGGYLPPSRATPQPTAASSGCSSSEGGETLFGFCAPILLGLWRRRKLGFEVKMT